MPNALIALVKRLCDKKNCKLDNELISVGIVQFRRFYVKLRTKSFERFAKFRGETERVESES